MFKFVYLIPLLPLLGFLFNATVGVRVLTVRQPAHAGGLPGGHHGAATPPHPLVGLVACGTVGLPLEIQKFGGKIKFPAGFLFFRLKIPNSSRFPIRPLLWPLRERAMHPRLQVMDSLS